MQDILENYKNEIAYQKYYDLTSKALETLEREHWLPVINSLNQLKVTHDFKADSIKLNQSIVEVGSYEDLNEAQHQILATLIQQLIPWRKGPFSLFGNFIDTEWVSDLKWQRMLNFVPSIYGKRVVDIGCNNGYYMWRLWGLAQQRGELPEFILGLDPSEIFYFSFQLMQKFINNPKIAYKIMGVEEMDLFPNFFDVAFYLGVIYHQRDPLISLYKIKNSLRSGGNLLLETIIHPGEGDFAFFVKDRYAKMRNVYFLPTKKCLQSWLEKTGFKDIEISEPVLITKEEQRKTVYMPYESLEDFLDKEDSSKTVEGLPAPLRIIIKAAI